MYSDSETRAKVLEKWLVLADCSEFVPYLPFYTTSGILSRPSDLYKLGVRHLFSNRDIPDDVVGLVLDKVAKRKRIGMGETLVMLLPDLELGEIEEIVYSPCDLDELTERCKKSLYAGGLLEELERLVQVGVEFYFGDTKIFEDLSRNPFTDKKIAIAGTLSAEHGVVKESLKSLGAVVQNKINKDTDFLILGEGAPEETDLAIKIGVKILTESDVAAMLGV